MKRINVELLQLVKRHILADPTRLDMDLFIIRKSEEVEGDVEDGYEFPKCGTIGCIAGWAVSLSGEQNVEYSQIADKAEELLNLSCQQASRLFYDHNWPEPFAMKLSRADPQSPSYAEITAARIDHFIVTKGAQ